MDGALLAVGFIALVAWFMWAVIRADARDGEAYDRWLNDPRQVWNGGQGNISRR